MTRCTMMKWIALTGFVLLARYTDAQIVINEVCTTNGNGVTDYQAEEENWVELYNAGSTAVDLLGYGLADNDNGKDFIFPSATLFPGQFTLVFISGKDKISPQFHTAFKLKAGETLYLYSPAGTIADQIDGSDLQLDHSKGRFPDGSSTIRYFNTPTPFTSNNAQTPYAGYAPDPVFTQAEGFYHNSVSTNITTPLAGATIHYTTNGDRPTALSPVWTSAQTIHTSKTIRAMVTATGLLPSGQVAKTYFVNAEHSLPVVNIVIDSVVFFDTITGLFHPPNHLSDTEYKGVFQFFEDETMVFEQELGVSIHGGSVNRAQPMKSLRLSARKMYGNNEMEYPFFDERDYTACRQLVLRNGSSDFCHTQMRDEIASGNLMGTHNDVLAHRPCVVYINGMYWGLYNLREKRGRHNLGEIHGIDDDNVDILRDNLAVWEGDTLAFGQMYDYAMSHDFADSDQYDVFAGMMDMENFADYMIGEIYYGNFDWPFNNIECWRERTPGSKFRYMLFDLDVAFTGTPWADHTYNLWTKMQSTYCDTNYHINMFEKALTNVGFYRYFVNRYCDLLNTIFTTGRLNQLTDHHRNMLENEIPLHFARWQAPLSLWEEELGKIYLNNAERPALTYQHLQQALQTGNSVHARFQVHPEGAGKINLNTITLEENNWEGNYFDAVPVNLSPVTEQGHTFLTWKLEQDGKVKYYNWEQLNVGLKDGAVVTAIFGDPDSQQLLVFPNPVNNQATIRVFNPEETAMEIQVTDMTGRGIYTLDVPKDRPVYDVQVDMSYYEPGVYMAHAKGKGKTFVVKFIHQ